MDFETLQKQIEKLINEQNNTSNLDFEGYSPSEMNQILYYALEKDCPVKLRKLSDSDCEKVPMFCQIKFLTDILVKDGEIKLTNKGNFPTKLVKDIYQQGFIKDEFVESGISKLYKESDSMIIRLTRIILEISGIVKKRNGKLSLTKNGAKIIADNFRLLEVIIDCFIVRFNWAYFDGYEDSRIGNLGNSFSLILLSKYGHKKELDSFYAEKYFRAFPQLKTNTKPTYGSLDGYVSRCYSLRTFERFLNYFGVINIEAIGKGHDCTHSITKTDLFDKMFKIDLPSSITKGFTMN